MHPYCLLVIVCGKSKVFFSAAPGPRSEDESLLGRLSTRGHVYRKLGQRSGRCLVDSAPKRDGVCGVPVRNILYSSSEYPMVFLTNYKET